MRIIIIFVLSFNIQYNNNNYPFNEKRTQLGNNQEIFW